MGRSILIYISGIDGSGKTTAATFLYYQLKRRGLPVVKIWFRFPYLSSYLILLIARLSGLTKVYRSNDKTFTVHFFEQIAKPYMILFVLDFSLHFILRIIFRALLPLIIIVERGPLDNLDDLLSDISKVRINNVVLKFFLKLQMRGVTILTTADINTIMNRRIEARRDPKFILRYKIYKFLFLKYLAKGGSIIAIDTQRHKEHNFMTLMSIANTIRNVYGYLGYGKKFSNPYLKAFFANRWIILATNWLLQGSMIADPIENIIRLVIDVAFFSIALMFTANLVYAFIAFLLAHTLNYILNSNCMHIIRFFKRVDIQQGLEKVLDYLKNQNINRIEAVVIFGSFVRNEVKPTSDLDIRVIRKRSIRSAIRAYIIVTKLRFFALRNGIPLDIFIHTKKKLCKIVDSYELKKMYVIPYCKKENLLKECQLLG